jgi:tRNA/tmRNA/rRNA uracil-C5-methylase (TrmA/RlmC/RlmD family)
MKRFEDLLTDAVRAHNPGKRILPEGECQTRSGVPCPICYAGVLEYPDEWNVRNQILHQWWRGTFPDVPFDPIVRSPQGRFYRSLTKRKAFKHGRTLALGLIDPEAGYAQSALQVHRCAIEPLSHNVLYDEIASWLKRPAAGPLSAVLNYVIIKGDEHERIVTLNVITIDAPLVRTANLLSKAITTFDKQVRGVFLYEDKSGGRYYLGMQSSGAPGRVQRLFGAGTLSHKTAGKRFVYPLLAFSQINQSMLEILVTTVADLLHLPAEGTLYDLYCGYGLFGIALADRVKHVIGVDISPASIDAARQIARHLHLHNVRFLRNSLTAESVATTMQRSGETDCVVLDPPRGGTVEGVIEVVAGRQCHRVVHLFCNIDIMPQEVQRWRTFGYRLERAVPLDMFPGTAAVEIAGVLVPQREGIRSKGMSRMG